MIITIYICTLMKREMIFSLEMSGPSWLIIISNRHISLFAVFVISKKAYSNREAGTYHWITMELPWAYLTT